MGAYFAALQQDLTDLHIAVVPLPYILEVIPTASQKRRKECVCPEKQSEMMNFFIHAICVLNLHVCQSANECLVLRGILMLL